MQINSRAWGLMPTDYSFSKCRSLKFKGDSSKTLPIVEGLTVRTVHLSEFESNKGFKYEKGF